MLHSHFLQLVLYFCCVKILEEIFITKCQKSRALAIACSYLRSGLDKTIIQEKERKKTSRIDMVIAILPRGGRGSLSVRVDIYHQLSLEPSSGNFVVFISERSEVELIGNGNAGTALQNGCGLERKSSGERQRRLSREIQCRNLSMVTGIQYS